MRRMEKDVHLVTYGNHLEEDPYQEDPYQEGPYQEGPYQVGASFPEMEGKGVHWDQEESYQEGKVDELWKTVSDYLKTKVHHRTHVRQTQEGGVHRNRQEGDPLVGRS